MNSCSVSGCEKPVRAGTMCAMHYKRRSLGMDMTAPQMIASPGEPMKFIERHAADPDGPCLTWPFARFPNGYANLGGYSAIREMCRVAHGEPPTPKHQAAHTCNNGAGGCIHPQHLSWKTPRENQFDRIEHGTSWLTRERDTAGRFV